MLVVTLAPGSLIEEQNTTLRHPVVQIALRSDPATSNTCAT